MARKSTILLVGCLLLGILGACSWNDDSGSSMADTPTAKVRVVHASPDAPAVDVQVDGKQVLSDVPFQGASPYLELGTHASLKVLAAGTSNAVIDVADLDLTPDTYYTILAAGKLADIHPLVIEDDPMAPAAGNARVRVIHAAPDAPAVDVYVTAPGADLGTAQPTLAGAAFEDASDYLPVPADDYRIRVTAAGDKTVLYDSGTITLDDGAILSIAAVGSTGYVAPIDLLALTGDDNTPVLSLPDNRAEVRVMHLSPDAPNVDVYVDGNQVLSDVPFKAISDYLRIPGGTHNLEITATGSSSAVASLSADLASGQAYSVAAVGLLSNIALQATADDLSLPDAGNAHLRAYHASPDAPNVDVLVDGSVVLADVPFKAVSDYLPLPAGQHDVKINVTGTSTTVLNASPDLADGGIYTAVAVGLVGDSSLDLVLQQDR